MATRSLRFSRCREKFNSAVYRLAVGEGDVRNRLQRVYPELRRLREVEVPPEHWQELSGILHALTAKGPMLDRDGSPIQSAIEHTLGRMRNSTGRRHAERIYRLVSEFNYSYS